MDQLVPRFPKPLMEDCLNHQLNLIAKKAVKMFEEVFINRCKFVVKEINGEICENTLKFKLAEPGRTKIKVLQ